MPSKTTILEALSRPSPPVDASKVKTGGDTTGPWPIVDNWRRWNDFNARDLRNMYRSVVDADWVSNTPDKSEPSRWDRRVFDEDSLDHYISRFILPDVNMALSHARHVLGMTKDFDLHIGRGGRCSHEGTADRRFKPDWSLCSDDQKATSGDLFQNLLPGDSKLSEKWRSDMYRTEDHYRWQSPVSQILHYISALRVRYGWLITDAELIVFRICAELTGPGQAIDRPRRQAALGHERNTSVGTTISQLSSAMQSTSLDNPSSSYKTVDGGIDGFHVEYQTVPWEKHGGSRLSVRLALFYLAMMAGFGARRILVAYPALDSWWWSANDDGTFTHNTTGMPSRKKPQNLEYPDPTGPRDPEWVTFSSDDGESHGVLTRTSARTLEIDTERQQHYYVISPLDTQSNPTPQRVYVDENMLVFDEDTRRYGRFKRLVWVHEATEQGQPQHEKRPREKGNQSARPGKKHKQ